MPKRLPTIDMEQFLCNDKHCITQLTNNHYKLKNIQILNDLNVSFLFLHANKYYQNEQNLLYQIKGRKEKKRSSLQTVCMRGDGEQKIFFSKSFLFYFMSTT